MRQGEAASSRPCWWVDSAGPELQGCLSFLALEEPEGEGLRLLGRGGRDWLAAVVTAFGGGLPGDRGEGALKEAVVDDVTFTIFAFDDPVAGIGFALSRVCEDEDGVKALRGID